MRGEITFCIHCGEVNKIENGTCTNCGCLQIKNETLPDEQPVLNNIMAQEQIFAQGIRIFDKHPNQPDFVLASQAISLEEFFNFCRANPQFLSDYQGKKQLKLQILRSRDGKIYMAVDTYGTPAQPAQAPAPQQQSGWGAPAPQQPQQQPWGAAPQQAAAPPQNGWGAPQQAAPAPQQQQAFDYDKLPF